MKLVLCFFSILFFTLGHAAEKKQTPVRYQLLEEDTRGERSRHFSGFDIGPGHPFPAYAGITLGFNIEDEARLSAGYGYVGSWQNYSADVKFFLSRSSTAFYLGAGLSYLRGTDDELFYILTDKRSVLTPAILFGIDYQSDLGLHIGFGGGLSLFDSKILAFPSLALGWYF